MSLQASLQRIKDTAKIRGVSIEIEVDEGCIHVPDLYRHKEHPNSEPGDGIAVLRQVCAVADKFGLLVEIEYMADEPKLGELYSSCGFKEYSRELIVGMRRSPIQCQSTISSSSPGPAPVIPMRS